MKSRRAPRRYAQALFELAGEAGELDAVAADLQGIRRCFAVSGALVSFVNNSVLGRQRRMETLKALFAGRVDPLTWRFLAFLERKRRLPLLPAICACLEALREQAEGRVRVAARVAAPVDEDLRSLLAECVGRKLRKPVRLSAEHDPSLLGGFVFRSSDVVYDFSVAGALRTVRERWRTSGSAEET